MTQVAIIGAGIGGLTLYHALQQRGISAAVYEATPVLQEVGAGILIPSNGMQVLARLGLATEVLQRGCPLERGEIYDASTGVLQTIDFAPYTREFGYGSVAIHRAALHAILAAGVSPGDLHLGKTCVNVRTDGPAAVVSFADGSTVPAPIAVGADGIDSVVRQSVFPASRMRPWGPTGYRSVVSFDLPPHLRHTGQAIWGDGCECGFADIGDGRVYWYVSVATTTADRDLPKGIMGLLQQRVSGFPEIVRSLVAAAKPDTVLRTELYDLAPLNRWYHENVVLMGDAAHASTPYLGQGAAQAMEDAYVLAAMLARQTTPDAFVAFQQTRMKKANMVVQLSRMMGHFSHVYNPMVRAARNFILRSMPAFVTRRRMDQLFRLSF